MGSTLGPTLRNMFLCHFDQQWMSDCPIDYKPISYRKYVNNTFSSELHVTKFLNYMGSKYETLSLPSSMKKRTHSLFSVFKIFVKVGNFRYHFIESLHFGVFQLILKAFYPYCTNIVLFYLVTWWFFDLFF